MDPFSLTVGALGFLQAANGAGKGIKRIRALKDADQTVQQLREELHWLQVYLTEVKELILITRNDENLSSSLELAIRQARDCIIQVDGYIEYSLTLPSKAGSRVNKTKWFRSADGIAEHLRRLRRARLDLSMALTSHTA